MSWFQTRDAQDIKALDTLTRKASSPEAAPVHGEALPNRAYDGHDSSDGVATASSSSRLDLATYCCLLIFAAALMHSKAATEIAYGAAMLLWVIKIVICRERPKPQPLIAALLAFLLLSAISTALSSAPAFSWERMKSVALLIISVVFAQNVKTLSQVRTLLVVLILSTLASINYNGGLYSYGSGARIGSLPPGSLLELAGVMPGDVVIAVNDHRIYSPGALRSELSRSNPKHALRLRLVRGDGEAIPPIRLRFAEGAKVSGELFQVKLTRARPLRAHGSLSSAVTYGEVLLQISLLTWGLLLAATAAHRQWKWVLAVLFVLMCSTLGATLTRASIVSCGVAGLIVLWICIPRASLRVLSLAVLALVVLAAALFVKRERGLGMVAANDPGTEYRVLMWEDGLRLARQHPLFGIGMDTIKAQWRQFGIRAYERFPLRSHFHSTPIQLAAERGLLTLAAWICLMYLYVRLLWRLLSRIPREDWFWRGVVLGLLAATFGFLTSSLVHYNLGDSEVQMLFWFLMGIAIALHRLFPRPQTPAAGEA